MRKVYNDINQRVEYIYDSGAVFSISYEELNRYEEELKNEKMAMLVASSPVQNIY